MIPPGAPPFPPNGMPPPGMGPPAAGFGGAFPPFPPGAGPPGGTMPPFAPNNPPGNFPDRNLGFNGPPPSQDSQTANFPPNGSLPSQDSPPVNMDTPGPSQAVPPTIHPDRLRMMGSGPGRS